MAEIVKFTGSNADLFVRESADKLHAAAQVIVPETHTVLLIKDGMVSEALGAGRHDIFDTESGFLRLKKDSDCATVDFVFISKTAKLPMLWGTPTPFATRDPITGVHIRVGLNGELEFRVATPKKFYLELVGADSEYNVDKLKKRILTRLTSAIEPVVAQTMTDEHLCYTDFAMNKQLVSERLKRKISELFVAEYGLELCSFVINGAIISESDIMAVERKRDELDTAASTCPSCDTAVPSGAKFCPECGLSLSDKYCSECGAKVSPSAKYCSKCGKKIK